MATTITTDSSCVYVPPDGGERIRVFDEEIAVKVAGGATAGAYALITVSVAPGGGPPLHTHPGSETFVVLSGDFAFTERGEAGVTTHRGGPGVVFHAPSGVAHRFENVGPERGVLLIVFAPEFVGCLRELGAAFPPGAEPDMETMLAINAKYGTQMIHSGDGTRPEPPQEGAASAAARALAWRFARARDALIATVAACSPEQWRAVCADTGWTVGVQAHHIAQNAAMIAGMIRKVADGTPPAPITLAALDAANARHAEEYAGVTVAETVALLRENGAAAAEAYRGLTDDQLARTAALRVGGPPASVAGLIEYLAIGEIERHGAYLRSAIGA